MPTYLVTETNSANTSAVAATVAPLSGSFTVLGIARAGTSVSGVGQTYEGTYGSLVINADGTFTYLLNNLDSDTNLLGSNMNAMERFTYTYALDGIVQTAALTFQVNGVDEPAQVVTNLNNWIVGTSFTVDPLSRVQFDSEAGFLLDGDWTTGLQFHNSGTIINSHNDEAYAVGFREQHFGPVEFVNDGLIITTAGRLTYAIQNSSYGPIINNGVIRATATNPNLYGQFPGQAAGIETYRHYETVVNTGTIEVTSVAGDAIGIWSRSLHTYIENSGFIYVTGGTTSSNWNLIGIKSGQSDDVVINNSGTIHVVSTAGMHTWGIILFPDSTNAYQYGTVINSGTIVATTAIRAVQGYSTGIHVLNSGHIEGALLFDHNMNIVTNTGTWIGNLQFGLDQDMLVNQGTITGNVILGAGDDLFDGRGGSVSGTVDGGAGRDLMYGGSGNDQLIAGDGDDRVHGGAGADTLTGGAGGDVFFYSALLDSTAAASDLLLGFQTGADMIDLTQLAPTSVSIGTDGLYTVVNATVSGGMLSIRVDGAVVASDIVATSPLGNQVGTAGNDFLQAFVGPASLLGNGGNDVMFGTSADDVLDGGFGGDEMHGGTGDDIYIIDSDGDRVFEVAGGGVDEVRSWVDYSLQAFADNLTLIGSANIGGLGNESDNDIIGNPGNNLLSGDDGNDTLYGAGGADILDGGAGADVFLYHDWSESTATSTDHIGAIERGTDFIDISALDPLSFTFTHFADYWSYSFWTKVSIETALGSLVIRVDGIVDHSDFITSVTPTQGSASQDLLVGSLTSDWIIGNAGNDVLDGLAGSDTLNGGAGNDWLFGGAGSDVLTGGEGADRFYFDSDLGSANVDRLVDVSTSDTIYLDRSIFATLSMGTLSESAFKLYFAESPEHRVIYDSYSGQIYYDADGNGSGGAILFAIVPAGTALTAANFVVDDTQPVRNDFNGDNRSDILWRHDSGVVMQWLGQADGSFVWDENISYALPADWSMAGIGDFNGDGRFDVVWRHDGGNIIEWLGQADGTLANNASAGGNLALNWQVSGVADFNGDNRDDMLWRSETGVTQTWLAQANGSFTVSPASYAMPTDWTLAAAADFTGDGRSDILWRHDSGVVIQWVGQLDGSFAWDENISYALPTDWALSGAGDFNGDGRTDLVWRHDGGNIIEWLGQADGSFLNNAAANSSIATSWHFDGIGDFNGDNRDDLVWRNDNGAMTIWRGQADGSFLPSAATYQMPTDWTVQPESPWI